MGRLPVVGTPGHFLEVVGTSGVEVGRLRVAGRAVGPPFVEGVVGVEAVGWCRWVVGWLVLVARGSRYWWPLASLQPVRKNNIYLYIYLAILTWHIYHMSL